MNRTPLPVVIFLMMATLYVAAFLVALLMPMIEAWLRFP